VKNPQEPRDGGSGHLDLEGLSECAYSPQEAAPASLEHAGRCAECAARIEELSRLLTALADLPEPELPQSVLVRLDATLEQAWQEAEETAASSARQVPRPRRAWRRLAVSITLLTVFAGVFFGGLGFLISLGSSTSAGTAATSSAGEAGGISGPDAAADPMLNQMVQKAVAQGEFSADEGGGADSTAGSDVPAPGGTATALALHGMAGCFRAPTRMGYRVVGAAPETYTAGGTTAPVGASLVVYRDDEEPASSTVLYAVLYAGSCPDSWSQVLDEGPVSVSRR
jgi:hypothetical protein